MNTEKIYNKLDKLANDVRGGRVDNKTANVLQSIYSKMLYCLQVNAQTEANKRNEQAISQIRQALITGETHELEEIMHD